ncbi:MAG: hypothetical protein M0C28_47980 [Candidatus Moduliflexus flocculans]|nr:hypothetical protein [Candidatus Moduliflexus flocculans]
MAAYAKATELDPANPDSAYNSGLILFAKAQARRGPGPVREGPRAAARRSGLPGDGRTAARSTSRRSASRTGRSRSTGPPSRRPWPTSRRPSPATRTTRTRPSSWTSSSPWSVNRSRNKPFPRFQAHPLSGYCSGHVLWLPGPGGTSSHGSPASRVPSSSNGDLRGQSPSPPRAGSQGRGEGSKGFLLTERHII